jgi:hypothetical protein
MSEAGRRYRNNPSIENDKAYHAACFAYEAYEEATSVECAESIV